MDEWGSPVGSPSLRRVRTTHKLVLRKGPQLGSLRLGDLMRGRDDLVVLDEKLDAHGNLRARVGKDSTPRGVAVYPIGWVTAVKDGVEKIETVLERANTRRDLQSWMKAAES